MTKHHEAPEARQLPRAWTRGRREKKSRQRASGAKSPYFFKDFKKMVSAASLLGARHSGGGCGEQASKFVCCVLGQGT